MNVFLLATTTVVSVSTQASINLRAFFRFVSGKTELTLSSLIGLGKLVQSASGLGHLSSVMAK